MAESGLGTAGRYRSAGFFMLAFVLWLLALLWLTALLPGRMEDTALRYLVSAASELALVVPVAVYIRVRRIPPAALFGRADASQVVAGAFIGMLAAPVSMALGVLWELFVFLTGGDILDYSIAVPQTPWELAAALAATAVAAPLVEEPAFRGLALNAQATVFSRKKAIFFTAALFALMHGRLIGLPSILMISIVITYLAWHSGSLWPAVAAHCAYNAVTVLAAALMGRLSALLPTSQQADMVSAARLASAAVGWGVLALPFLAGCAVALCAYFRHTPRAVRAAPEPGLKQRFSAMWPWLASIFLLFCYLTIDVLRVYGIISY